MGSVQQQAELSFFFEEGSRPAATAIAVLSASSGSSVRFSISHQPAAHPYWLELLALGLTFDLRGLAPGVAVEFTAPHTGFGLPASAVAGCEALILQPGPHLLGGGGMLPVVRAISALGAELAGLPGVVGVGWSPAGTVMAPDYYRKVVPAWLGGGAFPGLGLAALSRKRDGAVETVGLDFFLGHEVRFEPRPDETPGDVAKYMVRLIHLLVENGPYSPGTLEGPGGEALQCSFTPNRRTLRIWR